LQVWFALVPRGCRAPKISYAGLEQAFRSNLHQLQNCVQSGTPNSLESFFKNGPQPGMMLALTANYLEALHHAPKKLRPSLNAQPVILALLTSVVEQLDEALRRK